RHTHHAGRRARRTRPLPAAATPRFGKRFPIEQPERDGRDEQHDLVERPGHREQAERHEPAQRLRDAVVTSRIADGAKEALEERQHGASCPVSTTSGPKTSLMPPTTDEDPDEWREQDPQRVPMRPEDPPDERRQHSTDHEGDPRPPERINRRLAGRNGSESLTERAEVG